MKHKRHYLRIARYLARIVIIVLLMIGCANIFNVLPPGSGTIYKKGCHPQHYGGFDAPTVYYVCIKSDAHPGTYWTWYIDMDTYCRYQIGDYINIFGIPFHEKKESEPFE